MSAFFPSISSDAIDRLQGYYRERLGGMRAKLASLEREIAAEPDEQKRRTRSIQVTKLKTKIGHLVDLTAGEASLSR